MRENPKYCLGFVKILVFRTLFAWISCVKFLRFFAIPAVLLLAALSSRGVVVYPSTSTSDAYYETSAANGSGWNYVGTVGDASGVYLGHYSNGYYVLTANHISDKSSFTLNGATYTVSGQQLDGLDLYLCVIETTSTDTSSLDALSNLVLGSTKISTSGTLTNSVNLIGYGDDGTSSRVKRGGANGLSSGTSSTFHQYVTDASVNGYTMDVIETFYNATNPTTGQAYAVVGDSGGGVFYNNNGTLELAGLMVAAGTATGTIGGTSINYNATVAVSIADYATDLLAIMGTAIPEPSAMLLMAGGITAMAWRRGRRRDHDQL